jgi:hypothetical protein
MAAAQDASSSGADPTDACPTILLIIRARKHQSSRSPA